MEKYRVMIVDDEDDIRTVMNQVLSTQYEVVEAADGLDALYKMRYSEPDLIVMDVMMPLMNGFSACEAIRKDEKFATIPVMFLSALNDRDNIRKGYASGANLYLTKPFDPERLLRNIEIHFSENHIRPRPRKYRIDQLRDIFDRVKNLKERVEGTEAEEGMNLKAQRTASTNAHLSAVYGRGFAEQVVRPSAQQVRDPAMTQPATQKVLPRLMVVDDEPDIGEFVKQALVGHFEVVSAQDGIEAIERIVRFEPDLLLVDAMMPRMSGYQLVQSIRRNVRFQGTQVVMMSGRNQPRDIEYAKKIGADEFLSKPFDPPTLHQHLTRIIMDDHFQIYPKRFKLAELEAEQRQMELERQAREQTRQNSLGTAKKDNALEKFIREELNE